MASYSGDSEKNCRAIRRFFFYEVPAISKRHSLPSLPPLVGDFGATQAAWKH